ncbi:hypothetical protein BDF14DRAFT_1736366, partial [Spinellus fusiger]
LSLSNRGIFITIIKVICELRIIDLTLRKPKTDQKKIASIKRKGETMVRHLT